MFILYACCLSPFLYISWPIQVNFEAFILSLVKLKPQNVRWNSPALDNQRLLIGCSEMSKTGPEVTLTVPIQSVRVNNHNWLPTRSWNVLEGILLHKLSNATCSNVASITKRFISLLYFWTTCYTIWRKFYIVHCWKIHLICQSDDIICILTEEQPLLWRDYFALSGTISLRFIIGDNHLWSHIILLYLFTFQAHSPLENIYNYQVKENDESQSLQVCARKCIHKCNYVPFSFNLVQGRRSRCQSGGGGNTRNVPWNVRVGGGGFHAEENFAN